MSALAHPAPVNATGAAGVAALIETRALSRTFGRRRALDGVDLAVGAGECLALFGPNGAGKTTLLRLLAGLIRPTSGSATIDGRRVPGGAEVRGAVGLISHQSLLYAALSPRENVELSARLHGVSDPAAAAERALERMQILHRADAPVRRLSRGMQQRVSVARAVVHSPRVLLLDEPFSGLDESGGAALSLLLAGLRSEGAALLLVTHGVAEGFAAGTRLAVMHRGRIVFAAPTAGITPGDFATRYRELVANA
jgi:heme exporter protein A